MRWKSLIALLALCCAILLSWSLGIKEWIAPPVANIPDDNDIENMTASLIVPGIHDISEFPVSETDISSILFYLRSPKYIGQSNPFPQFFMGELKITSKKGQLVRVTFFESGANPPVFTTNGHSFFWGNDKDVAKGCGPFEEAIATAHSHFLQKSDKTGQ